MRKCDFFKGKISLLVVWLVMAGTTLSAGNPWQRNLENPVNDLNAFLIGTQNQDDPCAITELPWIENFENGPQGPHTVGTCFNKIPSTTSHSPYFFVRPNPIIEGVANIAQMMKAGGANPSFLILPPIGENIPMENLVVKFKFNPASSAQGNGAFEIGVMDPANAGSFSRISYLDVSAEQVGVWHTREISLAGHLIGHRYLAIMAPLNSGDTYFDDFEITMQASCVEPANVNIANVSYNAVYLNWEGGVSDPESYIIEYKKDTESVWNEIVVQGNKRNAIIENLDQLTYYDVRIKAACASDTSDYVEFLPLTRCPSYVGQNIGEGTGNTDGNKIPVDFASVRSYTQQIFLMNEVPTDVNTVTGIAFQCEGEHPEYSTRLLTIYLGETDKTTFDGLSAPNWIGARELKQVFNGYADLSNEGWVNIAFDSIFIYQREKNLAVVVADNTNDLLSTTARSFYTHDSEAQRTMYWSGTGFVSAIAPPSMATAITTNRNNIRLLNCGAFECIPPSYVNVSDINQFGATLSWARVTQNAQYMVEYREVGENDWISSGEIALDAPVYTIENGMGNTEYEFRVMTVCGFGDLSDWSSIGTFRTSIPSLVLPLRESFDTYTEVSLPFGWTAKAPVAANAPVIKRARQDDTSAYHSRFNVLDFKAVASSYSEITLTNLDAQYDISDYQMSLWTRFSENNSSQLLIVGLMSDPNIATSFVPVDTLYAEQENTWEYKVVPFTDYEGQGSWITLRWMNSGTGTLMVDDIVIDRPSACDVPVKLEVSKYEGELMLSWDPQNFGGPWIVEYDVTGFEPGTGRNTLEAGTFSDIQLVNLEDNAFYDVYVKAKCNDEAFSWYSAPCRFRTSQIPDTLPYQSDFTLQAERDSWTFAGELYENDWVIGTEGNNTSENTYSLYVSNDGGVTNNFIINTVSSSSIWVYRDIDFDDQAREYQISFEWRNPSSFSYISVYIDTNLVDVISGPGVIPSTALPIATRLSANSDWQNVNYILPDHYGNKINRLYFQWFTPSGNNPDVAPAGTIRNIAIVPMDCPVPTGLQGKHPTANTVDLEWLAEDEDDAEWIIEYGITGFTKGSGNLIETDTNWYQVTGLDPETWYDFYVRTFCGEGDTSTWSLKATVKTGQTPLLVPFICDFEDDNLNKHWLIANKENGWFIGSATNIDPEKGKTLYISNDEGLTNAYEGYTYGTYAIRDVRFPSVTGGEFILTFDWRCLGQENQDYMELSIGDSILYLNENNVLLPNGIRYITSIARLNGSSDWSQSTYTLPSFYSDTMVRLVLDWRSNVSQDNQPPAAIDNISITYNSCVSPKNINVSNIRHNGAFVTWTQEDDADHWQVEYKLKEDEDWTVIDINTYPQHAFNTLTDSSEYQIRLRTVCGDGDTSIYSSIIDFTTLRTPCSSAQVSVIEITKSSATATWRRNGDEMGWDFSYKKSADEQYGETVFLTDTFFNFSGLTPDTEYKINIRTKCDDNYYSAFAEFTFRTDDETGINEINAGRNVVIYPNPAQNKLQVKADAGFETINVINLLGQVLYTGRITDTQKLEINVSSYESGVYFIRLEGKNGVVTKKFIKN